MKWVIKEPIAGDMIRIKSASIYHYGIYISDDEVIQFGLAPTQRPSVKESEIEVMVSDIDTFLTGEFLEVAEYDRKEKKKNRTSDEVVKFARSKLGTRGYHILYNNCEHFATECVTGVRYSSQADDVRAMFRSMPIADVYIAAIPEGGEIGEVFPKARNEEIHGVSNDKVKREKYYVWKLLEYGLNRSFGFQIKNLEFKKDESGRWSTPTCEFSLSHSDGVVAVAISRAAIGVDIEPNRFGRHERLAERAFTQGELAEYCQLADSEREGYFVSKWTAKEALFKSKHLTVFEPSKTEVDGGKTKTAKIGLGGVEYVYSVATDTPDRIRVFDNIQL